MNEPGNEFPNDPRPLDNGDTVESLRRQMNLLFGVLMVLSFTVTIYLGLEARRASLELVATQQRAAELKRHYQQDDASLQAIFMKLSDFGRTHPDFEKQVFAKYKFNTNAPAVPAKK